MADYGVTPEGFAIKTLPEIIDETELGIRNIFGADIDLSEQTPDGQELGLFSASHSLVWEIAEENYNAFDPAKATGAALDSVAKLNGLSRIAASYSTVIVTCLGTSGTVIPKGSEVSNAAQTVIFQLDESLTLGVGGDGLINASAADVGPVYAAALTLTNILTPISGWATATNSSDAIPGRFREVDTELRVRRERSVAASSQGLVESVQGSLSNLPGVTNAQVIENHTGGVVDTVPAHSIECIVNGGSTEEIPEAIFTAKSLGCGTAGSESSIVTDSEGYTHEIKWSRPAIQNIHLWISRITFGDYIIASSDAEIKANIVAFSLGEIASLGDTRYGPGDHVYASHLYSAINLVPEQSVNEIYMAIGSTPGSGDTATIAISARQLAAMDIANITISTGAPA
jgi:uncharacterized phage protein gp47/JayE